uniref:Uncharacterized protein n=1 Tax=Molossus molossus TaxID=27622 RepID=A0A7J8DBN7_MOLMO|nr:hypothetical protein HJG59_009332 [Molossus molossus]
MRPAECPLVPTSENAARADACVGYGTRGMFIRASESFVCPCTHSLNACIASSSSPSISCVQRSPRSGLAVGASAALSTLSVHLLISYLLSPCYVLGTGDTVKIKKIRLLFSGNIVLVFKSNS